MKTVHTQSNAAQASNPETLLPAATGCVHGRDRGILYCDLIIDEREHRMVFNSPAEFERFHKAVEQAGIPIHCHKKLSQFFTVAVITVGMLMTMVYLIDAR